MKTEPKKVSHTQAGIHPGENHPDFNGEILAELVLENSMAEYPLGKLVPPKSTNKSSEETKKNEYEV